MSITITKGKILKGDNVYIEYTKQNEGQTKPAECKDTFKEPPHSDLVRAFTSLDVFSALICEQIPLTKVKDFNNPGDAANKFHVSGFTILAPDDDDFGIILTAQRTLTNGKPMGFNTPITRFNDDSETAYPFLDEFLEATKKAVAELELYLGGKYAIDPQTKLDLEE